MKRGGKSTRKTIKYASWKLSLLLPIQVRQKEAGEREGEEDLSIEFSSFYELLFTVNMYSVLSHKLNWLKNRVCNMDVKSFIGSPRLLSPLLSLLHSHFLFPILYKFLFKSCTHTETQTQHTQTIQLAMTSHHPPLKTRQVKPSPHRHTHTLIHTKKILRKQETHCISKSWTREKDGKKGKKVLIHIFTINWSTFYIIKFI